MACASVFIDSEMSLGEWAWSWSWSSEQELLVPGGDTELPLWARDAFWP